MFLLKTANINTELQLKITINFNNNQYSFIVNIFKLFIVVACTFSLIIYSNKHSLLEFKID